VKVLVTGCLPFSEDKQIIYSFLFIWLFGLSQSFKIFWLYFVSLYIWLSVLRAFVNLVNCLFLLLCLCIHRASWHHSATLTEDYPYFFLSCKENVRTWIGVQSNTTVSHRCIYWLYWGTKCFGLYWPSSGCLGEQRLKSHCMYCARTHCRDLYITGFILYKMVMWLRANVRELLSKTGHGQRLVVNCVVLCTVCV